MKDQTHSRTIFNFLSSSWTKKTTKFRKSKMRFTFLISVLQLTCFTFPLLSLIICVWSHRHTYQHMKSNSFTQYIHMHTLNSSNIKLKCNLSSRHYANCHVIIWVLLMTAWWRTVPHQVPICKKSRQFWLRQRRFTAQHQNYRGHAWAVLRT